MTTTVESTSHDTTGVVRPGAGDNAGKWWAAHGLGSYTHELGHFDTEEEATEAAGAEGRRVVRCQSGETGWDALSREEREALGAKWGIDVSWMRRGGLHEVTVSLRQVFLLAGFVTGGLNQHDTAALEAAGLVERYDANGNVALPDEPAEGVRLSTRGSVVWRSFTDHPMAGATVAPGAVSLDHPPGNLHRTVRVLLICDSGGTRHTFCPACDGQVYAHRDLG